MRVKYLIIILLFSALACKPKRHKVQEQLVSSEQENMIKLNKIQVQKETEIIDAFVRRRNWKMQMDSTGLWYQVYDKKLDTQKPEEGDWVSIAYKIWLLDGTLCYEVGSEKPKKIHLGYGNIESGADRGIRMMREGEKARFILPPHLAHGLLGDDDKIPARSIILYDIELIKISDKK